MITVFFPHTTGLKLQLKEMVLRTDLSSLFWHFLERQQDPDVLDDVYDGRIFKEFQRTNKPFSNTVTWFTRNDVYELALQLNADAFQPYRKSQYSMTAVYAVVLNLPREIRYQEENIILLALIPGGVCLGCIWVCNSYVYVDEVLTCSSTNE
jgi:hypothetical protein